jgi:hypothetical protein
MNARLFWLLALFSFLSFLAQLAEWFAQVTH